MARTLLELQEALRNVPMGTVQKVAKGAHREVPQWMGMDEIKRRREMSEAAQGESSEKQMGQRPMIEEYLQQSAGVMGSSGGGTPPAPTGQPMFSGMPQQAAGPPMPPQAAGPPMSPQAAGPPQIPGYAGGGRVPTDWRKVPGMVSHDHLIAHQRGYSGEGDWRFKGILPESAGRSNETAPRPLDVEAIMGGAMGGAMPPTGGMVPPQVGPSAPSANGGTPPGAGERGGLDLGFDLPGGRFQRVIPEGEMDDSQRARYESLLRALKGRNSMGTALDVLRGAGPPMPPHAGGPPQIPGYAEGGRVPTIGYANGNQPVNVAELQRIIERLQRQRSSVANIDGGGTWLGRLLMTDEAQAEMDEMSQDYSSHRKDLQGKLSAVLPESVVSGDVDLDSYLRSLSTAAAAGDDPSIQTIRLIESYGATPTLDEYSTEGARAERRAVEEAELFKESPFHAEAEKVKRYSFSPRRPAAQPARASATATAATAESGFQSDNLKRLQESLLQLEKQIPGKKDDALMALAMAGATTMAGQSPYAMSNIGQGLQAGLSGYTDLRDRRQEQLRSVTGARAGLEEIHELANARREATEQRAAAAAARSAPSAPEYMDYDTWFDQYGGLYENGLEAYRAYVQEVAALTGNVGAPGSRPQLRLAGRMTPDGSLR